VTIYSRNADSLQKKREKKRITDVSSEKEDEMKEDVLIVEMSKNSEINLDNFKVEFYFDFLIRV
jgi:hypothetical protein